MRFTHQKRKKGGLLGFDLFLVLLSQNGDFIEGFAKNGICFVNPFDVSAVH
jgi:hypothetical protein